MVTQIRTKARDGYEAVQIGYGDVKQLNKPAAGTSRRRRAGSAVREFEADDVRPTGSGSGCASACSNPATFVDVVSTTKGRGFQGAMKRHGFGGGQKTHGQGDRGRAVGSIGAGNVSRARAEGQENAGHMGNKRKTVRKLRVELVDAERNLLFVRGPVPGSRNTMVMIRYAHGVPVSERIEPEIVRCWGSAVAAKPKRPPSPLRRPEPAAEAGAVEEQTAEADAAEEPRRTPPRSLPRKRGRLPAMAQAGRGALLMQLPQYDLNASETGRWRSATSFLGAPENAELLHQALVYHRANQRGAPATR